MSVYAGPNTTQDGLVLHIDPSNPRSYPGTGNTIFDITKNGNNGTLINGASVISRGSGRALEFDGSNDCVDCGTNPSLGLIGTDFTLSAWVWLPSHNSKYRCLVSHDRSQIVNTNTYEIGISNLNKLYYYGGDTLNIYPSTFDAPINTWFLFTAVGKLTSSSTVTVTQYFQGSPFRSDNNILAPRDFGTGPFYLGVDAPTGGAVQESFLLGQLDDIRIYNRALTAAEIRQNFNATRARFGV